MDTLVPTGGGGVVNPPTKNVLRRFKMLADLADEVVERHDEINRASRNLFTLRLAQAYVLQDVELPTEAQLTLTEYDRDAIQRAQALFKVLDPEHAYNEDNGDEDEDSFTLKREVIGDRLALLIGSFPRDPVAAPENFARMLIEHVAAENVSCVALHTACFELVATRKAMPSIAAVMDALAEHQTRWARRRDAVFGLAEVTTLRLADLRTVRGKVEAAKRAGALRSAEHAVAFARHDFEKARKEFEKKQTEAGIAEAEVFEAVQRLKDAEEKLRAMQAAHEESPRRPDAGSQLIEGKTDEL